MSGDTEQATSSFSTQPDATRQELAQSEDDSDFVLVVNKKKHAENHNAHHNYHKPRPPNYHHRSQHGQQQQHHPPDHDEIHVTEGRRKKFRERRDVQQFRRHNSNQQNNRPSKNSQQQVQQISQVPCDKENTEQKTATPQQQQQQQPATAWSKTLFPGSAKAPAASSFPPPPPPPVLVESNNEQQQPNGAYTNRQLLMVVAESSSSSPRTGSVGDTASVTSENESTLDSLSGTGRSSLTGSDKVEYVDAPPPKVNPWVANRNAAHVITTGAPLPLPEKRASKPQKSISKSSPLKDQTRATSPQKGASPPTPQTPQPPPSVSASSKASSRSTNQVVESILVDCPPIGPQPYYREMSNGFRQGRGRGSYSASARKIPTRSQVLMKVLENNAANDDDGEEEEVGDWPTLGEAVKVTGLVVDTTTSTTTTTTKPKSEMILNEEDEVDCAKPTKAPPASPPVRDNDGDLAGSSSHDSDNERTDQLGKRRPSKQKWVPLDLTEQQQQQQQHQQSRKGSNNNKGPPSLNKGKQYGSSYSKGKGNKENMMNGNDYYYEPERLGPPQRSYYRGGTRGRGPSSRGSRRHHNNNNNINNNRSNQNHSQMNGHVEYELVSTHHHHHHHPPPLTLVSAQSSSDVYTDYPTDFTTLTPMYPAVSEFIMPYVANGYFPTPFSPPPPGVIVEPEHVITTTTSNAAAVPLSPVAVAVHARPPSSTSPFNDLAMLIEIVRQQIEYYFSSENLEKDFYLRRKMDSDGYLPVHLIATFPRVKNMTQDYDTVLSAIQASHDLELKRDLTSVRTRTNPEKWPIRDSTTTILHSNSPPPHTPITYSYSSSQFKPDIIMTSQINNNQHELQQEHGGGGVVLIESLNPNVPEFVPKAAIV